MKHLLNICNINGAEVEPVDVIIGGSPCQDLSVAGKRAGLDGERSGLFMEQIRIIKEMRYATNGISPRYMVWENVLGAFSSNKGEDFRVVLEETAKIADEAAVIPRPDKGKWTNSGAIMGDGWSIAWRVFDAQFWGVPQRRRRIALVADFGGQSAPEILFKSDSVSGDIAESGAEGQGVTGGAKTGTAYAVRMREGCAGGGKGPLIQTEKSGTLGTGNDQTIFSAGFCQGASPAAQTIGYQEEVSPTIKGAPSGTAQVPAVFCLQGNGIDRADTAGCNGKGWREDVCYTLNTVDRPAVFSFDSLSSNSMKSSNPHSGCRQVEIAKCIDTTNPDPSKNQGGMAVVYDARGNGDGTMAPTMTGDHQNRVTDYTGIVAAVDCRNGTEEVNDGIKALQILRKDYGDTNVLEWAKRVQKSIQKTDLLRQRVHESGISEQAENRNELDDDTLPRPELVAEWLMRDVREHQEHRCSSQRRKPSKQPYNEPTKIVQELPQQTAQTSKELFNMWKSGQGLWILREALSAVQKMGKSICVQGEPTHARNSVRRLTPLEAERLQGFPDNWTNIPPQTEVTAEDLSFWRTVWNEWQEMNGAKPKTDKQIIKWLQSEPADSARYKALGNSIALPPWRFVLSRIHKQGARTMASLFDGIGGFPKIWQELGGQTLWCSEVEPFPIAVTRYHFKEEQNG